ncbi:MAG: hypothetical protein ACRD21_27375 [Vicinamibacteria bacterium]
MSIDERGREDQGFEPLDASAGLYHEAQADGVPYEEGQEPFSHEYEPSRA